MILTASSTCSNFCNYRNNKNTASSDEVPLEQIHQAMESLWKRHSQHLRHRRAPGIHPQTQPRSLHRQLWISSPLGRLQLLGTCPRCRARHPVTPLRSGFSGNHGCPLAAVHLARRFDDYQASPQRRSSAATRSLILPPISQPAVLPDSLSVTRKTFAAARRCTDTITRICGHSRTS